MMATLYVLVAAIVLASAGWWFARRGVWRWAVGLDLAAFGCLYVAFSRGGPVVWVVVAAVVAVAGVWLWHRYGRSSAVVNRWGRRARRTHGVATSVDILRTSSTWAMRRRARTVRPSLGRLSWRELRQVDPTEFAVRLLRVGRQWVWASVEDVITIFGGPRTGKTGLLSGTIIDSPGAAIVTSTRLDLMQQTRALRETGGRPVYVFNPGGLGGTLPSGEPALPSTLGFDPLTGCADPVTATERAADMVPEAKGSGDRSYWDGQARRVLAAHLHAAALGGRTMHHVLGWIADPAGGAREVRGLLRDSPQPAFAKAVHQFSTTNDRTQSSITSTIMPALEWLSSPAAVAATETSETSGRRFDVAELLRSRGTVYLLGRNEAHTSPLMAALVGYIAREARRIASAQPGGRIDPPLSLCLDEAGRAAAVPLDDWTGDAGGSGITIVAAFQSRADLIDRWGPVGSAKILNNSGAVVLFGGTKDHEDLKIWSELAGDRDEVVVTHGRDGRMNSRSVRQVKVLPPAQLSNLPAGRAIVFRRGMSPVIGRPLMAWHRRDIRAAEAEATQRAAFEQTLDTAWGATWVAGAGETVVNAAERFARDDTHTDTVKEAADRD